MNLVNLTAHDITIFAGNGEKVVIPKSGQTVRVTSVAVPVSYVLVDSLEIPLVETRFGNIEGLPAPEPGVLYVVSALAAQAAVAQGRVDVVAPDTGPESAVRDDNGNIVGVRRFTRPSGRPRAWKRSPLRRWPPSWRGAESGFPFFRDNHHKKGS